MADDQEKQIGPESQFAEAALIGALFLNPDAVIEVSQLVFPPDFTDQRHIEIYQAVVDVHKNKLAVDQVTVSEKLKAKDTLDKAGGTEYLSELSGIVLTDAHIKDYARLIATSAQRRHLMKIGQELIELGKDEGKELDQIIQEAERKLLKVGERQIKEDMVKIETVLMESFKRLEYLSKNKDDLRGISSGFKTLDNLLAGFQKSDLFVIAGRPGMGKTAFCLNLARNMAINKEKPQKIAYFSLEMSKEQLVDRLLAAESGIDAWNVRTGRLSTKDFDKIGDAMGVLGEASLFIDDSVGLNANQIRSKARRQIYHDGLDLIVVDYIQLMVGSQGPSRDHNRVQEVSEISRDLKGIAREFNIPVIAVSQLSRSVESRDNKHPQLADLRESGAIEQDADVVAFLYRDEYYNPDDSTKPGILEIQVKKHRNGPIGNVELYFDKNRQRYGDLEKRSVE